MDWFSQHGLMNPVDFQSMTQQQRMGFMAPRMLSGLGAGVLQRAAPNLQLHQPGPSPNPCLGVICAPGEHCVDGRCLGPCSGVVCPMGTVCVDGACVPSGASGSNVSAPVRSMTSFALNPSAPTRMVRSADPGSVAAPRTSFALPGQSMRPGATSVLPMATPSDTPATTPNTDSSGDAGSSTYAGAGSDTTAAGAEGGGGAVDMSQGAAAAGGAAPSSIPTWVWVVGALGAGALAWKAFAK